MKLWKLATLLLPLTLLTNCQTKSETISYATEAPEKVAEVVEVVKEIHKADDCAAMEPNRLTTEQYDAMSKDERQEWYAKAQYWLERCG